MNTNTFSDRLLQWFDHHGRKDLPWQQNREPYGIWVSEIMLQQTQVNTVIPYYQRFMARFPDITSLADAEQDDVLHLWTGLGYYARARNLHKAAQQLVRAHNGEFPQIHEDVQALPGIGRSTAAAILAFAFDQRHAILDGNVKRVLTRYHAVAGWPGNKAVETQLWQLAEQHTPAQRIADYTQAIMDLGATLCRRSKPHCGNCPQNPDCQAFTADEVERYPTAKPRKALPEKTTAMLLIRDGQHVLLQQRPPTGIWGSLWSLPECPLEENPRTWGQTQLGLELDSDSAMPVISHTFSHFRLHITPIPARLVGENSIIMEQPQWVWYNLRQPPALGLAAPVKRLLDSLKEQTDESNG